MATGYQGISDTPQSFNTSVGSPDFGFLQQNLYRSNQQYEQGLSQIKQDYSAITSTPLTNGENIDKRNEYVAQIQEGLKKVAPTDVSLPQNVQQAENLYAPFWKDSELLQDQAITKDSTNKLQQADSDRQSKDEKIRNSYNPWSVTRQQYVLEDLRNAKRGDGSIGKVQRADYLPITDYQSYVNDQDKLMGFTGIDKETPIEGSLYIRKEHDGIQAIPSLKTRYDSMLGSKFQAEFSQQGWVQHRQELDAIARNHPEIPREQLNQELAKNKYQEVSGLYDKQIGDLSNDLYNTYQLPLKSIYDQVNLHQGGKATKQQLDAIDRLENGYKNSDGNFVPGQSQFNSRLDQLSTERQQFMDKNPDKTIVDIATNPENYYATSARQTTIDKLASARASDYTSTLELNKVLDATMTHRENEAHIQNDRLDRQQRWNIATMEDRTKRAGIDKDYVINGYNPVTGQTQSQSGNNVTNPSGDVLGQTINDQQHVSALSVLEGQKNNAITLASAASFGAEGTSERLKDLSGINDNDVLQYNTLMQRIFSPEGFKDASITQKPQEKAAFEKIYNALKSYFPNKDIPHTYNGIYKAQNDFIADQVKTRSGTIGLDMSKDPYNHAYSQSKIALQAMEEYVGKVTEQGNIAKHLMLADKHTYQPLLSDDGTRMANVTDIAKGAPTLDITDGNGNHSTITPHEYAQAFLDGKLDSDHTSITINNRHYNVDRVNGQNLHSGPNNIAIWHPVSEFQHNLEYRYGTKDDRDKLMDKANDYAAANMPSVAKLTGKTGMDIGYSFGTHKDKNGDVIPGNGERMIREAIEPSNNTGDIKIDGKVISDEDHQKLMGSIASDEDIRKHIGYPTYSTVTASGQSAVKFVWKDTDKEGNDHPRIVEIPLSPKVSGTLLKSIPRSSGLYIYNKLTDGSIHTQDATDEAMGFQYTVKPDNADNPTYLTVSTSHKILDAKTGKENWASDIDPVTKETSYKFPISGGYNADALMQGIEQRRFRNIAGLHYERGEYIKNNAK